MSSLNTITFAHVKKLGKLFHILTNCYIFVSIARNGIRKVLSVRFIYFSAQYRRDSWKGIGKYYFQVGSWIWM